MAEVQVGQDETFESALKRFNRRVQMDRILSEARKRSRFEKPSQKRKREEQERIRKLRKKMRRTDARDRSPR
ncbi:MAG: 30S ribosomal protein S21 [Tepidiformaceae bacterium]|nr:30S ribosomal protein S21 [Dehalococcoidia bacterium]